MIGCGKDKKEEDMKRFSINTCLILTLIAIFCISFCYQESFAASFEDNQKALNMIADFSDRLCKDIPLQGHGDNLDLSGSAKAELNGIIKKLANLGVDGAIKYQNTDYEGLLQKDLVSALKDSTNCRLQIWNDLKDKLVSSSAPNIDSSKARFGVTLGWQLARYEFIYDSPFPEVRNASAAAKKDIEMMLRQDKFPPKVNDLDSRQLISTVLLHYGSSDPVKHSTILLGIAAMRASLIGSSSDQKNNEEIKQLANSAIQDIDSRIIQKKQELFDQIVASKSRNVTAVLELLYQTR
jgi:hypothetical protein